MQFTNPGLVEEVLWTMRLADLPRGTNRARIDRLANGLPPYTKAEQEAANIKTNVNFLEFAKLAADARRSYYNAFMKPGKFFTVTLDHGPVHKRRAWGTIITRELNKVMKKSRAYFELLRNQFAGTVLHGVGPVLWDDKVHWCPRALGIEDVMIPSNTLLTLENLNYFGIFRQYTPMELYRMTHGPKVDSAWNMEMVDAAIKWADQQTQAQISYSELYAPEKIEERFKQDLGFYGSDAVPTIDTWDFWFWSDEGRKAGWRRRMVLDTPMNGEIAGHSKMPPRNVIDGYHKSWLYNPGERVYADRLDQIVHFQFGDLSAVAPFHYHSVRSLGWLLYAVCHLQNRLRCKVNDHLFENLQQYFRLPDGEDRERVIKIDLHDKGVVPEGVDFVKQADRWQANQELVALGLSQNRAMMDESAAQFREGRHTSAEKEKTATEIIAEVNSATALVGSMLTVAYTYEAFKDAEIARRFCVKNSPDPEVREFRKNCLAAGVPQEALNCSTWNIEPERVIGSGNKTLQIAIADKLMSVLAKLDPESQRELIHLYVEANSDDPDLTNRLVPLTEPKVSESRHDAELTLGTLLMGLPVSPRKGQNIQEVIEVLLAGIGMKLKTLTGPPTMQDLIGLANVLRTAEGYIEQLSEDPSAADNVRQYRKDIGMLQNLLKKLAADAQRQSQNVNGNGGGIDPKDAAKVKAMDLQAQVKARNTLVSHTLKTKQRQTQFLLEEQRKERQHNLDMRRQIQNAQVDTTVKDIQTAGELRRSKLRSMEE